MNPYQVKKREAFEAINASIDAMQARAAEENRDLTEDELKTVRAQSDDATKLAAEIKTLHEAEQRAANVSAMQLSVRQPGQVSAGISGQGFTASRDPGHYRSAQEGGTRSFFADMYSSAHGDREARSRLEEHTRAITIGTNGIGIVAPKWLTDQYNPLLRQGRVLPNVVTTIPLGTDPRPFQIPDQTGGATVTIGSDLCANPTSADNFVTALDTVTPTVATAMATYCRSFLDASDTALDVLVWNDMMAAYDLAIEAFIGSAIVTAAGAADVTFANEAAFDTAGAAYNSIVTAAMDVWQARKLPADIVLMRIRRWGHFLKYLDTTGRPLFPSPSFGNQSFNSMGTGSAGQLGSYDSPGSIDGVRAVVTDGMGTTAYPESLVVQRASDVLFFEGTNFRFEDPYSQGPAMIRLALWNYVAVYVRYAGNSGKRIAITAA